MREDVLEKVRCEFCVWWKEEKEGAEKGVRVGVCQGAVHLVIMTVADQAALHSEPFYTSELTPGKRTIEYARTYHDTKCSQWLSENGRGARDLV